MIESDEGEIADNCLFYIKNNCRAYVFCVPCRVLRHSMRL